MIGHPVGHSLSPAIHNAGFDHTAFNGVYLPMPIPPEYEHFKATVLTWLEHDALGFGGASVTIPHKANLLRFVEEQGGEIEPLSIQIGAANTLVKRDDGSLYCCNTDYAAAIDSLCEVGGMDREAMADKRIAVLGAGGAARAIVAGLSDLGATVVIYNRTREKADALAEAFGDAPGKVVAAPLENLCKSCCHAVVNCTPLGMHPHVDASPIDPDDAPWGKTARAWWSSTRSTTPPRRSCSATRRRPAARRCRAWRCSSGRRSGSSSCGPVAKLRSRCFAAWCGRR